MLSKTPLNTTYVSIIGMFILVSKGYYILEEEALLAFIASVLLVFVYTEHGDAIGNSLLEYYTDIMTFLRQSASKSSNNFATAIRNQSISYSAFIKFEERYKARKASKNVNIKAKLIKALKVLNNSTKSCLAPIYSAAFQLLKEYRYKTINILLVPFTNMEKEQGWSFSSFISKKLTF